jgi:hypothetical protein
VGSQEISLAKYREIIKQYDEIKSKIEDGKIKRVQPYDADWVEEFARSNMTLEEFTKDLYY